MFHHICQVPHGKLNSRLKDLEEMKRNNFYQQFKLAVDSGASCEGLEEPDPNADISDGSWEDLLRKWKIQIALWLKQRNSNTKTTTDIGGPSSLMPLCLVDSTSVGEIVEKVGDQFLLLKVQEPECYAFVHLSR